MATLVVQEPSLAGLDTTEVAATAGGDDFPNDGKTWFSAVQGAGTNTVTFAASQKCEKGTNHNNAVVIPTGKRITIGPFPVWRFGTSIAVTYTGVTNLTVGVRRHVAS